MALLTGVSDLGTRFPDIVSEWHPTRNDDLTPELVTAFSNKKVWWLGGVCGHEWDAPVSSRTRGSGCPVCAGQRVLVGLNDLVTLFPEVAVEWHPTKNDDLTPEQVMHSSNKKVWWLGKCGHEWDALIASRTDQGSGCPICVGQRVLTGFNDLGTRFPSVATEWHPTLNGGLAPGRVTGISGKKVWWLGVCGHEWEALISNRTRKGYSCPFCSGQRLLTGFNDLGTLFPDIAAEWHPTKNDDLTPERVRHASEQKVWWLGKCGHEWIAYIGNRTRGHGCPECACYATSMEEIRLRCELAAVGLPIDETRKIRLPGRLYDCDIVCSDWKLIIEFDGNWYHNEARTIKRDITKTVALTGAGWTVIRVRDGLPMLFENDVSTPLRATALDRAKAVIRKAAALGFQTPQYDEYLASDHPLGEDAARVIIGRERQPARSARWRPRRYRPSPNQMPLW